MFTKRIHYFPLNPNILLEFLPYISWKRVQTKQITDSSRVIYYNLIRSTGSKYLYSSNKKNFDKKEYTVARINYIEELYKIFWNFDGLDKDYHMIQNLKKKYKWTSLNSNFEMFERYESKYLTEYLKLETFLI